MSTPRQALYQRLPEIYHIRDAEQHPPGQLKAYLDVLDEVLAGVRNNVEALYHDLFIETCADWVIPYIADLLGTSHLSGDPWTLRADVARTVHHRRRKGTLGAIESLTYALSGWAVHSVELRERLAWNQHLNHQRPDAGGAPPWCLRSALGEAVRGGTVNLRDPALLSFIDGPFDPFAHVADVKPVGRGVARLNVPNLAIFLWRLQAYTVPVSKPVCSAVDLIGHTAAAAVRCIVHPLGEPMQLFNVHHYSADEEPPNLADEDAVPGPIPAARLTQASCAGRPRRYVQVLPFDPATAPPEIPASFGLSLHMPLPLGTEHWHFRGANLCAWEEGLHPPLDEYEIVIDPERGRVLIGVSDRTTEADPIAADLVVSATYGFSGPTGAHPIARDAVANPIVVNAHDPASPTLEDVLANIHNEPAPAVVEIQDSLTHEVYLADPIRLKGPLRLRAASGQRPVIKLGHALRFQPFALSGPEAVEVDQLDVVLEGLYLTRGAGLTHALIQQAAVNRLVLDGCTLDPGGSIVLDGSQSGTRQPIRTSLQLDSDYGYTDTADRDAFNETQQIPAIVLRRTIAGPLAIDENYSLTITESIIDAGSGEGDPAPALAVGAATGDPDTEWGPPLTVLDGLQTTPAKRESGLTCFGRMRVASATGEGGIWIHRLEVHDDQRGCIKFSYFSGNGDRLPPHHGCVFGSEAALSFVSHIFGQHGYAQLRLRSDRRILEEGPGRDAMGAFGYLLNAHKWKNINIRYREFMPVGMRPVLIPVT